VKSDPGKTHGPVWNEAQRTAGLAWCFVQTSARFRAI